MWKALRIASIVVVTAVVLDHHSAITAQPIEVDLLLVLAADVSRSVGQQQFNLQREGYAAAISNPRVIAAIRSGRLGRIAVCYIEWSGSISQKLLIDWSLIDDAASARRFASQLAEAPRSFDDLTSVSAAIDFAVAQIEHATFHVKRRVIDISGDGEDDNVGRPVTDARDEAITKGVTINGIVVFNETAPLAEGAPQPSNEPERYYRDNVIGGTGAFVMAARNFSTFGDAILNKLIMEIADRSVINTAAMPVTGAGRAPVR